MLVHVMKRTTITLPKDLVDGLLEVVAAKNKTQAVTFAVQEVIRRKKMDFLKALASQGKSSKNRRVEK
jgi:hypothetical protein